MTEPSFVESLDLASDARLDDPVRPMPKRGLAGDDAALRGKSATGKAATLLPNGARAAVNGGVLVSFVAGLDPDEMDDVLYSTQLAQRAASAKHDRFAATEDWYGAYSGVLSRLGWGGGGFSFSKRTKTAGEFTIDRSAIDIVTAFAIGNQLAILVKAVDTLKKLAGDKRAIRLFELQAQQELSGCFQLGAVQRAENGALALALGAFHFRTKEARRRALFVAWGADEVEFFTAGQKLTLNRHFYAGQHREAVIKRLAKDAANYVEALEIV